MQTMKKTVEIRWHGRGGQGAKTAALLLADVAFKTGRCVQGFPEYGPERMGAPITAFNRISEDRIRVHSNIYDPDYVVVVDETLLHSVHVTDGLKKDGAIIINTPRSAREIRGLLRGYEGRIFTVDARQISEETLFAKKPEVIKGNMAALEMAYDKVEMDMAKTNVSPVNQKATAKQMKQSA